MLSWITSKPKSNALAFNFVDQINNFFSTAVLAYKNCGLFLVQYSLPTAITDRNCDPTILTKRRSRKVKYGKAAAKLLLLDSSRDSDGSTVLLSLSLALCWLKAHFRPCNTLSWPPAQKSTQPFTTPMAAHKDSAMPVTYHRVALQIRESGDLLRLPFQAVATALVFLHRFKQASLAAYADTVSNWLR